MPDNKEFKEPLIIEFYLGVHRCPDGIALGSNDLRNRGHCEWPEITVWPKNEHFKLISGGGIEAKFGNPQPVTLTATEKRMMEILHLNELELGVFLREWTPNRGSDLSVSGNEKKMFELGPEGRPKNLEDLLTVYFKAGGGCVLQKSGRKRAQEIMKDEELKEQKSG